MGVAVKKRTEIDTQSMDALSGIASDLARRVPSVAHEVKKIATALHELLDGQDERSRILRIGIQHYLIEAGEARGRGAPVARSETLLTTEEAADLMQCSRPYVAMLIDNKKLIGASVTEGGHRRVPEKSVRAWIKDRNATSKPSDYRAAAAEGGMYDIPEEAFVPASRSRRSK